RGAVRGLGDAIRMGDAVVRRSRSFRRGWARDRLAGRLFEEASLPPRGPYPFDVGLWMEAIAWSSESGSSSLDGDAEGKRPSSCRRAISRASLAIWVGSLSGFAR